MQNIKNNLANLLHEYIDVILEEYNNYIPEKRKKYLQIQSDYTKFIEIADTKTISLFYRDNKIYFPILAFQGIEFLKNNPNYGINPNHKCYDRQTLIRNKNTFRDYIEHVIIAGITAEKYFEESLLHETMHFCGSRGGDPLREGLTELKTRELALKKGLLTSACGYPKEISVVIELQDLFGTNTMNKIAFAENNAAIADILEKEHGAEATELYFSVRDLMDQEFQVYYKQNYDGIDAPMKKAAEYEKIDYSSAYELIEKYKEQKAMTSIINSINTQNNNENPEGIKRK